MSSLWSKDNYTALTTIGMADPQGSNSTVTCSRIRAIDVGNRGVSIGEFALPQWMDAMAGSTVLVTVVGNNTLGADPSCVAFFSV